MAPHKIRTERHNAAASNPTPVCTRRRRRHADPAAMMKITARRSNTSITIRTAPVIPYRIKAGGLWREFAPFDTLFAHRREGHEALDAGHSGSHRRGLR